MNHVNMESVISARITITFDELFLNMFVEFDKLEKLDASQMNFYVILLQINCI